MLVDIDREFLGRRLMAPTPLRKTPQISPIFISDKARAKNPKVVMRVTVQDETDEGGKPRVNVVTAF
jgi:hypothetical protein